MIFLIEYERARGRIVKMKSFEDSDRATAEVSRLNLELDLNLKGIDHEVVLLEAVTEEALRKTHGRYFESWAELISAPAH